MNHWKSKHTLSDLTKVYVACDIIGIDDVMGSSKEEIMKTILNKVHPYKISQTSDGRYVTYIADPRMPNGRRQIRRKSISDLHWFLMDHYSSVESEIVNARTFRDLYDEWIQYKEMFVGASNNHKSLSPSTIKRYRREYDEYILPTKLNATLISEITGVSLTKELTGIIAQHHLSESSASNMLGYVKDAFAYAMRSRYLKENPADYLDRKLILSKCSTTPVKNDSERVLTLRELQKLRAAVDVQEAKNPHYIQNYAIELAMMTGMRVGEIAALRWDCIDEDYIYVDFSEHRLDYIDKPSELAIGAPKCGKHRIIPVTDDIRELMSRIQALGHPSEEGFVFTSKSGVRATGHTIGCAVDRRAAEAGIQKTSIHGIRRTISSMLNQTLDQTAVAAILGHSEQVNERHYHYDTSERDEKLKALSSVSSKVIKYRNIA